MIKRKRYIVMRKNRTEIWCGVSKHFYFKKIDEIGNVSVKTYESEARAKASCSSWDRDFEIVEITETLDWSEADENRFMQTIRSRRRGRVYC